MPHIGNFPERGFPKPLSIPAAAFVPRLDTYQWLIGEERLQNQVVLTAQDFHAPVYLPQGAVVTKLILYGLRNAGGSELRLWLSRDNKTGLTETMAMVLADWTGGWGEGEDTSISYATIDNDTYHYSVRATVDPDAVVSDCYFGSAEIEWK